MNVEELRIAIIDDEPPAQRFLKRLVSDKYGAEVIVGIADRMRKAQEIIKLRNPNVLLLDVNLTPHTGFDIIESIPENQRNFDVIFITNYKEEALQAFRYAAVDYILKPVLPADLYRAIDTCIDKIEHKKEFSDLKKLFEEKQNPKISLPLLKGRHLVINPHKIVHIQSFGDISHLKLKGKGNSSLKINLSLNECNDILEPYSFFKIHRQHIINLDNIHSIHLSSISTIQLKDKSVVPLARRRKKEFITAWEQFQSEHF